jgi:hypothetical protein
MYRVGDQVSSDASGNATIPVWPPLRETGDGNSIITHGAKGLFRLKNASGNKSSVNVGSYGIDALDIVEAL